MVKQKGRKPEEYLGSWRIAPENRFEAAQHKHEDWFARQFELDSAPNYYVLAREEYNRGWVSYLTAVWQMLRERIEADAAAREKHCQQSPPKPELPANLKTSTEDKPKKK